MKPGNAVSLALGIGVVIATVLVCIASLGEPDTQNLVVKAWYAPAENKTTFTIFYPSGRSKTVSAQGLSTTLRIMGASVLAPPNGTYVVSVISRYRQLETVVNAFLGVMAVDVVALVWLEIAATSTKKLSFGHVILLAVIAVSLVITGAVFVDMIPATKVLHTAISVKMVDPATVPAN